MLEELDFDDGTGPGTWTVAAFGTYGLKSRQKNAWKNHKIK
jgi:hypothetical protein